MTIEFTKTAAIEAAITDALDAEMADATGVAEATIRKWASRKLIRASGRRAGSPTFDVESVRRVAARTG